LLDRGLALYGPEANDTRSLLRGFLVRFQDEMWPKDGAGVSPSAIRRGGDIFFEKIQGLSPKDEAQRALKGQVVAIAVDIGKARALMYAQHAATVSTPLLVVLVLWLTYIFISFGLFAPLNATAISGLFVAALSVAQ